MRESMTHTHTQIKDIESSDAQCGKPRLQNICESSVLGRIQRRKMVFLITLCLLLGDLPLFSYSYHLTTVSVYLHMAIRVSGICRQHNQWKYQQTSKLNFDLSKDVCVWECVWLLTICVVVCHRFSITDGEVQERGRESERERDWKYSIYKPLMPLNQHVSINAY